eukprot:EC095237.1.p2 GENE.EC095237.1~~EC095237.1.p2  ORF type:complete len:143 (+),score=2.84 EC095237.1:108-536(+)
MLQNSSKLVISQLDCSSKTQNRLVKWKAAFYFEAEHLISDRISNKFPRDLTCQKPQFGWCNLRNKLYIQGYIQRNPLCKQGSGPQHSLTYSAHTRAQTVNSTKKSIQQISWVLYIDMSQQQLQNRWFYKLNLQIDSIKRRCF